eukprot:CAMPEP_0181342638 /NCGR_PEP_ID=MMETSP1101-20121128/31116_1 /TAXON_ID=46948 /ORGANISM="Rhodomonas abbreviata, Strain Caron Lab Isolate" /LENGTH=361 /DNA_ID=CAMNT_0023454127 /DNA_START=124 /DNA_END=1209 /DNA_ORIENTATION=-
MVSPSQKSLSMSMMAVAAAALLALVALTGTAHVRSVALLEAKQDVMHAYIKGAEKQLASLEGSLPDGKVALQYPKEESELKSLLTHSLKGLSAVEHSNEKKAAKQSALALTPNKKHLDGLVRDAASMMATLRAQLPPADRKAFPAESKEMNDALGGELKSLQGIHKQLTQAKKAPLASLHAAPTAPAKTKKSTSAKKMQKALDDAVAKDREENKALSANDDVANVLDTFNARPAVSAKGHLIPHADPLLATDDAPAAKDAGEKARPQSLAEQEGALTSSGIRKWGTVYDPSLAWQAKSMRGQANLYPPAQKEFNYYESEASKFTDVHDPAKDGHEKNSNWWADKASGHDAWWAHNHAGRGY